MYSSVPNASFVSGLQITAFTNNLLGWPGTASVERHLDVLQTFNTTPAVPGQPSVNAVICKPGLNWEVFAAVNGSGYSAHKGSKS